jgi:hypothetical protein
MGINMVLNVAVTDPRLYEAYSPSTKSEAKMDKSKQNGNHPAPSVGDKDNLSHSHEI